MKLSSSYLPPTISRSVLLSVLALGLSAAGANAAKNVNIPLAGKAFGDGVSMTAQSDAQVDAAHGYYFRLTGTCHGTGNYESYVPQGTNIRTLFNEIQAGAAASLTGTIHNSGGTLPPANALIDRTYSGDVSGAQFSLTLSANISASGAVTFEVKNVSVTYFGQHISGTIEFEQGAKIAVGVAPTLEMAKVTQTVSEAAGKVLVSVERSAANADTPQIDVNAGVNVQVHYTTVAGTADKTDFKPVSGVLTILAGHNSANIKVPIKDNTAKDGSRSFKVVLSKPIAAFLDDKKATTVTITDND